MLKINALYRTSSELVFITSYDVSTNRYHGITSTTRAVFRVRKSEEYLYTYCGSYVFFQPEDVRNHMQQHYPEYFI